MPISSHELINFRNRVFVETGSAGLGWGINSALIAGFEKVYSIDINPVAYNECNEIFKNDNRVNLSLGDCGGWLEGTLNKINEPCTIYLDANGWALEKESPFDSAIEAIIRHGKKYHTILVDDMNHGKKSFDAVQQSLLSSSNHIGNQLRRIDPNYLLYIIDSHLEDINVVFPAWVAVAKPPSMV